MIQPDVNASLGFPTDDRQHHFEAIPQRIHGATRPVLGQGGQNTRDSPSVRPAELSTVVHVHLDVGLTNRGGATDVFDVSLDTSTVPSDWTIALAWSQHNAVLLRPNETVQALFTLTAPADAAPDTVVEFDLRLTSQNDTSRSDVKTIPVSASMVSIAEVALQQPYHGMSRP